MLNEVIADLETYNRKDLHALAKFYKLEITDNKGLIKAIARAIIKTNDICKNYVPNLVEETRLHLLDQLASGIDPCDLIKDLPVIGQPSTNATIYDYHPNPKVRVAIKVTTVSEGTKKDINLSQLLSGEAIFPHIYLSTKCGRKLFTIIEMLDKTFEDLIRENVSPQIIIEVIKGVLDAIDIMLRSHIVHTDLHAGNIMIRCTGPDEYQVVIIDFDLVNNPERDLKAYALFDVYDFMRRMNDNSTLEANYPQIHIRIKEIYQRFEDGDEELLKIQSAGEFKQYF